MSNTTRTHPNTKFKFEVASVGKRSDIKNIFKSEDKNTSYINVMDTISILLNEKKCTLNTEILDIKNGILLAIKTVQENLNNKGNDYFKDLDYYHELDKNGVLAYNRLINENIEDLKNICYHTNFNPFSPDRKFSFFGTNYTKTAINLRNKLETDIADKINFMNSKNIALKPIIPENISKFLTDTINKDFDNCKTLNDKLALNNKFYNYIIDAFDKNEYYAYKELNNDCKTLFLKYINYSSFIIENKENVNEIIKNKFNECKLKFKKNLSTFFDMTKKNFSNLNSVHEIEEMYNLYLEEINSFKQSILYNYKYLCHSIINQQQYLLGKIDKLHSIKDEIDSQERKSYFSAIDKQDTVSLLSKNCSLNSFLNKSTDDTANRENLNDYSFFSLVLQT